MAFTHKGRLRIGRRLGSGACGVVFEAFDTLHHRNVAVKLLTHVTGDALVAFKREFRSVAGVRHPNLVQRHELLSDGRVWFFTMELIDGLELLEYLARNEIARSLRPPDFATAPQVPRRDTRPAPVPPAEAGAPGVLLTRQYLRDLRVTMKQLVDGVCALHVAGHLHRDIKPSNVLVTPEGRVVLVDFGLVVPITDTADALIAGTPGYMSPEQAAGESLNAASDWFSVGVLLYQALTGQMPWPVDAFGRTSREAAPIAPKDVVPDVPADLNDLALALLALDPAHRPAAEDIRRRIGADTLIFSLPAVRAGTLGQPTFIGRSSERAALHTAFDRAVAGHCTTASVHGEPGIGKTALVHEFFDELRGRRGDVIVLAGRCSAREWVPYNALDAVIENLAVALTRADQGDLAAVAPASIVDAAALFPVMESVPALRRQLTSTRGRTPDVGVAADGLRWLLGWLAARQPVVVFVDDAQWGDLDAARLLRAIVRGPDAPPILVICAYPADDAATGLMLRDAGAELRDLDLHLGPMTAVESAELARSILAQWPRVTSSPRRIATACGGNPFLIDFLARHHKRGHRAVTLLEAVRHESSSLEPDARALLAVLAASAEPLELSVAYDVAAVSSRAFEAVSSLRERRLARSRITGTVEELEIYHPRIRAAVIDELDPLSLRSLYQRLAQQLEHATAADPERLYRHYLAAGCVADASRCAIAAAEAASRALAFTRAAALYEAAFTLDRDLERMHQDAYAAVAGHAATASGELSGPPAAARRSRIRWSVPLSTRG